MLVLINGQPQDLDRTLTIQALVESMSRTPEGRGVAVAVDGQVVPRSSWADTTLSEGARVEIVAAVQGG